MSYPRSSEGLHCTQSASAAEDPAAFVRADEQRTGSLCKDRRGERAKRGQEMGERRLRY